MKESTISTKTTEDQFMPFKDIAYMIWRAIYTVDSSYSAIDNYILCLFVMYSYYHGYFKDEVNEYELEQSHKQDSLYQSLMHRTISINNYRLKVNKISKTISKIDHKEYKSKYLEILGELNHVVASDRDKETLGKFLPQEILSLITYFIRNEKCHSILNPRCGSASIIKELFELKGIHYVGQESDSSLRLIAEVFSDAATYNHCEIYHSLQDIDSNSFDAIINTRPFQRIAVIENDLLQFKNSNAKLFITIIPNDFYNVGDQYKAVKQIMINYNLLDTVIYLPSRVLYETSTQPVLLICKKGKKDKNVLFFNAERKFLIYNNQTRFNTAALIHQLNNRNNIPESFFFTLSNERIKENNYNLERGICFLTRSTLRQAYSSVKDVLELKAPIAKDRNIALGAKVDYIDHTLLKSNIFEIIEHKNASTVKEGQSIPCQTYENKEGDTLILELSTSRTIDSFFALRSKEGLFSCPNYINVYQAKKKNNKIIPEFIIYQIISEKLRGTTFLSTPLVLESLEKQKAHVDKIQQEYDERKQKEKLADEKRSEIKGNIADVEHMIAPTQMKLTSIARKLKKYSSEDNQYQELVDSLRDNIDYMKRVIHFFNQDFDKESLDKKQGNLTDFINLYAKGWGNYGGNYFELIVDNELTNISCSYDETFLIVMLDSILENAGRHGFHKIYTERNLVVISCEEVKFNNNPYVCIKVSNNGDPMEKISIDDYITRGRFNSSTGRSGLGGYHVYQIVKGHNGFLFIDRNNKWNVIIEILLPIQTQNNNLKEYNHECI